MATESPIACLATSPTLAQKVAVISAMRKGLHHHYSPEISQPQIAKINKISPRSVSRIVGRLKEYGYLRRVGSDHGESWGG